MTTCCASRIARQEVYFNWGVLAPPSYVRRGDFPQRPSGESGERIKTRRVSSKRQASSLSSRFLPPPGCSAATPGPDSLHRVACATARSMLAPPTTPSPSVPPLLGQEGNCTTPRFALLGQEGRTPPHPRAGGELLASGVWRLASSSALRTQHSALLPSCRRRGGAEGDGVVGVAGVWRLASPDA
jgi:hypothetical protein